MQAVIFSQALVSRHDIITVPRAILRVSDDGSLRVYGQSSLKVLKAVRGLGSEISSVVPVNTTQKEIGDVWLACGQCVRAIMAVSLRVSKKSFQVLLFDMDLSKLILSPADARTIIELCSEEDDVLNEVRCISPQSCQAEIYQPACPKQ
jgi:hypothetical protein